MVWASGKQPRKKSKGKALKWECAGMIYKWLYHHHLTYTEGWLRVRNYCKCFSCVNSFDSPTNVMRWILWVFLLHKWGHLGIENLCILQKIIQLIRRARIQIQAIYLESVLKSTSRDGQWQVWVELTEQNLKITTINMLQRLMEKVDNMQEQMGNISREVDILWKNQCETLEIKNIITEMKNTFAGSLVDWTQWRK